MGSLQSTNINQKYGYPHNIKYYYYVKVCSNIVLSFKNYYIDLDEFSTHIDLVHKKATFHLVTLSSFLYKTVVRIMSLSPYRHSSNDIQDESFTCTTILIVGFCGQVNTFFLYDILRLGLNEEIFQNILHLQKQRNLITYLI